MGREGPGGERGRKKGRGSEVRRGRRRKTKKEKESSLEEIWVLRRQLLYP